VQSLPQELRAGQPCPQCGVGQVVLKKRPHD
jgi:hypothetical protein